MIEDEKHLQRCVKHIKKMWDLDQSGIVESPSKINNRIKMIVFGKVIEDGEELLSMNIMFQNYFTSTTSVPGKYISHNYIKEIIMGVLEEPEPKMPIDKFRFIKSGE